MKFIYLLLIPIILFSQTVSKKDGVFISENTGFDGWTDTNPPEPAASDSTFFWDMETSTANYNIAGDTSPTINDANVYLSDTQTYNSSDSSLYNSGGTGGGAQFTIDGTVCDGDSGTVRFYVYGSGFDSGDQLVHLEYDNNNYIYFMARADGEIRVRYVGNGTERNFETSTMSLATGSWTFCEFKWRTNASPYISITVGATTETYTTALVSMTNAMTELNVGPDPDGAAAAQCYIDDIKVWNYWKE